MPKHRFSGRSRPHPSPPPSPPPHGGRTPTPSPLNDSGPDPERFDPNRTPPPPANNIFNENLVEEKIFELPPLRSMPRPLTGRPPAPQESRGVKRRKGSGSRTETRSYRRAAPPTDTDSDPLERIQSSLHQIQTYLNTLAAVDARNNAPQPHLPVTHENPPPRALHEPNSSPATLADMLTVPQRGTKRYARID